MPYIEREIERRYFSVGQVARKLNVASSCVRFWCQNFGINPLRNPYNLKRKFTPEEVETLLKAKELKDTGHYTIAGVKAMLNIKPIPK